MTGLRVLGRVRLSRLKDESTSVERQKELIRGWAELQGNTIAGWAIDTDLSRSINPFEAPELGPWLSDPSKINEWDVLVVWRLDRLGAGSVPMNNVFGWCDENRKKLVSVTESFDLSTDIGRIVASIIAMVSKSELDAIKERTQGSRQALRELARWPGGIPPYGYEAVKGSTGWKLRPDPIALEVVRRILTEYLDGLPVDSIAAGLTADKIPSPRDYYRIRAKNSEGESYSGKEPEGRSWKAVTLHALVTSESLLGHMTHKGKTVMGEDGNPIKLGEALISQQEFDTVQVERARRHNSNFTRDRRTGPLLGIVKCLECGANLHYLVQTRPGKEYRYYYCSGREHGMQMRAEELEQRVESSFLALLGDQPRMHRVYIPAEDHTADLEAAVRAFETLTESASELTSPRLRERLKGQLRALDIRISDLEAMPHSTARTELRETGSTYGHEWGRLDVIGRRNLLRESGIQYLAQHRDRTKKDPGVLDFYQLVPADIRERLNLSPDTNPTYDLDNLPPLPPGYQELIRWAQERGIPVSVGGFPEAGPTPDPIKGPVDFEWTVTQPPTKDADRYENVEPPEDYWTS